MPDKKEVCVLIAASLPATRKALKILLNEQEGLKVVSEAQDSHELLKKFESTCPDILLLEWEMLGRATPVLINVISTSNQDTGIVVLSSEPAVQAEAMDAGADAFVNTSDPPRELMKIVGELTKSKKIFQET